MYRKASHSLINMVLILPALAAVSPAPKEVVPDTISGVKPRNVVYILSDDHRFDAMSFLGHQFAETPVMDSIAANGAYLKNALVMMEIDWSVGEIMAALRETGIENDTIFLFTTDNGPWEEFGNHAGKTPFREHKGTSFEGGVRSALTVKYPARLKPGTVNDRAFGSIDLWPTLAALAGISLKENSTDGKNLWPLMSGDEGAENPHDHYFISTDNTLEAALTSDGKWKLHHPHEYRDVVSPGQDGERGETKASQIEESLFHLIDDPLEEKNLIADHPEIAGKLREAAAVYLKQYPPPLK